ncbi:MAG TPA: EamA family transporter [Candidatus Angelobacter sp.]|nr:EamA family transporter [Candidatus Angelobacter sp.]
MPTNSAETPAAIPATEQGHPWRGYFFIATATFCWGAAATAGKALFNGELFAGKAAISPVVLSQARTSFAVALLAVFLLLRYGREFLRIGGRDAAWCALVGVLGLTGSNYFYYLAIQHATVAIAITLQYTAPVWVLLWTSLRGHQPATLRRAGAVALALAGIALTIGLFQSDIRLSVLGTAAGLLASFSFSFYNIAGQQLVSRHHPFQIMFYVLLASALFWLVVNPPWRLVAQHFSAGQWGFLFLFACLSTLLPYFFFFTGLKYLDPTRAVIASCLEPVFAVVFAAVFVGESVRALQVVGILAVLAATVMAQAGGTKPLPEAD